MIAMPRISIRRFIGKRVGQFRACSGQSIHEEQNDNRLSGWADGFDAGNIYKHIDLLSDSRMATETWRGLDVKRAVRYGLSEL